jgi:hypothetical protein
MDKKVIGKRINAIHLRSYFKPSQKEGNNWNSLVSAGLKKITVATLKAVKINRYIKNNLIIHCIVLDTLHFMNIQIIPFTNG